MANYVYDLPGLSRFLGDNWLAKGVLDNWQISGISQLISGTPFELGVTIAGINSAQYVTGSYTDGPRFLLKGDPASGPANGPNGLLINPDSFVLPAIGSTGIGNRQYLRVPRVHNHDISFFKNIPISKEGARSLQLRLEMFNFFNHTQFSSIASGTNLNVPNPDPTRPATTGVAIFNNYGSAVLTNNLRPAGNTQPIGSFFGEYNGARAARVIQLAVKVYF